MMKFLILYIVLSSLGWIWVIMGISTLRDLGKVQEQERARTTAKVVDLIREDRRVRSGRFRTVIRTVWHPVVAFQVDSRQYRIQSAASMMRDDLRVGEEVDILYDADDPTQFHFHRSVEHDARAAKIFIVVGLVWALLFSPFLIHKELYG